MTSNAAASASQRCIARHAHVDAFLGSAFARSPSMLPLAAPRTLGEYLVVALPAGAALLLVVTYWVAPPAPLVHPASRAEQCVVRLAAAATHATAWCAATALAFHAVDVGLACHARGDGAEAGSGPTAADAVLRHPVGDDALRLLVVLVGTGALLLHWVTPWRTVRCLQCWWLSLPALDAAATAGVLVADLLLRHADATAMVECWSCAWARLLFPLQAALAAATASALVFARAPPSASAWRRSEHVVASSSRFSSSSSFAGLARPATMASSAGARRPSRYDLHLPPFDGVGRDASRVVAS